MDGCGVVWGVFDVLPTSSFCFVYVQPQLVHYPIVRNEKWSSVTELLYIKTPHSQNTTANHKTPAEHCM